MIMDLSLLIKRVHELNPTIYVREANLNDGDQFVTLFNSYYKRKTTLEYFKWQFFETPNLTKLFLAFDANKLVAHLGVKQFLLSNYVLCGFAVDLFTDEAYRNKGISYLLQYEVEEFCHKNGMSVLAALPNSLGNGAFKSLNWNSISKINTMVLASLKTFNNNFSILKDLFEENKLIRFEKDILYLKWRFEQNPIYEYKQTQINEKTFAITKLFTDPINGIVYGDIVNISFTQHGKDLNQLIENIRHDMNCQGASKITIWALPQTQLYLRLLNLGFEAMPQERYFCVKLLIKNLESLKNINNWDLVEADSEVY